MAVPKKVLCRRHLPSTQYFCPIWFQRPFHMGPLDMDGLQAYPPLPGGFYCHSAQELPAESGAVGTTPVFETIRRFSLQG